MTNSVKFAHFAVSDIKGGGFHCFQKLSRGAFGEAGFGERQRLAWIEDWSCEVDVDGAFRIMARADDLSLELALKPEKPLVIHGQNGISKKAEGEAIPRLQVQLEVSAGLNDQELRLKPIEYWEGSVRAWGTIGERSVKGSGYLEMTGYSGPIAGMQAEP